MILIGDLNQFLSYSKKEGLKRENSKYKRLLPVKINTGP